MYHGAAVVLFVIQRRRQDGVCDVPHLFALFAVPQDVLGRQHADDSGFPLSSEDLQSVLQGTADVFLQFCLIHDISRIMKTISKEVVFIITPFFEGVIWQEQLPVI